MTIDFAKTKYIVEECWKIACTAQLPGGPPEMSTGIDSVSTVRWQLFQQLVSQLVPNNQILEGNTSAKVQVANPKEEWESDDPH